jgi:hypothetical protein
MIAFEGLHIFSLTLSLFKGRRERAAMNLKAGLDCSIFHGFFMRKDQKNEQKSQAETEAERVKIYKDRVTFSIYKKVVFFC